MTPADIFDCPCTVNRRDGGSLPPSPESRGCHGTGRLPVYDCPCVVKVPANSKFTAKRLYRSLHYAFIRDADPLPWAATECLRCGGTGKLPVEMEALWAAAGPTPRLRPGRRRWMPQTAVWSC